MSEKLLIVNRNRSVLIQHPDHFIYVEELYSVLSIPSKDSNAIVAQAPNAATTHNGKLCAFAD